METTPATTKTGGRARWVPRLAIALLASTGTTLISDGLLALHRNPVPTPAIDRMMEGGTATREEVLRDRQTLETRDERPPIVWHVDVREAVLGGLLLTVAVTMLLRASRSSRRGMALLAIPATLAAYAVTVPSLEIRGAWFFTTNEEVGFLGVDGAITAEVTVRSRYFYGDSKGELTMNHPFLPVVKRH